MKKIIISLIICMLSGCTTATNFGPCIGIGDTPNPNLQYQTNALNVILGIVFVETIIVPAVVIISEVSCPVAKIY